MRRKKPARVRDTHDAHDAQKMEDAFARSIGEVSIYVW